MKYHIVLYFSGTKYIEILRCRKEKRLSNKEDLVKQFWRRNSGQGY